MKKLTTQLLMLFALGGFAQENKEFSTFTFEIETGLNLASKKLKINQPSDDLIYYGKSNAYLVPLEFGWYFHKHWGLAVNLQMNFVNSSQRNLSNFNNDIENKFGGRYFYTPKTQNQFENENSESIYLNYFIGAKYKTHFKKLQITSSLYYGTTEIELDRYSSRFKEKGGNEIVRYGLVKKATDGGESYQNIRTYLCGIQLGYPLNSFLYVQTGVKYLLATPEFSFIETLTYQLEERQEVNEYKYDTNISMVQMGISLLIEVNKVPSFGKKNRNSEEFE